MQMVWKAQVLKFKELGGTLCPAVPFPHIILGLDQICVALSETKFVKVTIKSTKSNSMKLFDVLFVWGGNNVSFWSFWLCLTVFHSGLTCILMRSHSACHTTNEHPGCVTLVSGLWQARGGGSVWFPAQQFLSQPHGFPTTCLFLSVSLCSAPKASKYLF